MNGSFRGVVASTAENRGIMPSACANPADAGTCAWLATTSYPHSSCNNGCMIYDCGTMSLQCNCT
jgi:hypothetical protein